MRIESLQIDGFGHFANKTFELSGRMTVICGPNEAGKSTLLAFIRTILFGFPSKRGQWYPPISGGRHGGRVVLIDDYGARFVVERIAGPKGGSVSITAGDGRQMDPAFLGSLRGNVTQNVFEGIFAFGLDELQSLSSLSNEETQAQIYAAGTGATSLPKARVSLNKRADEIFLKGGQNQPVARLLKELERLDQELDGANQQAATYGTLTGRRLAMDVELRDIVQQTDGLQKQRRELETLQQARDDWNALGSIRAELAEIPDTARFPEDGQARLEKVEVVLRASAEALAESEDVLIRARAAAEAPVSGGTLLDDAEAIEALRRGQDSFANSVRDLPRREAEAEQAFAVLTLALADLGTGWTADRLPVFDTSTPVRGEVDAWRSDIDDATRRANESELTLRTSDQARREAVINEEQIAAALASSPKPGFDRELLEARRVALRAAFTALDGQRRTAARFVDIDSQVREMEARPPAPGEETPVVVAAGGVSRPVCLALMVLGLITGAGGALVGGPAGAIAVVVGVVMAIAGAYLFARQPGTVVASHVREDGPSAGLILRWEEARAESERETSKLAALYANLIRQPAGALPGEEELNEIDAGLRRAESVLQEYGAQLATAAAAHNDVTQRQARFEAATSDASSAAGVLAQLQAGWRGWLAERGMPETLTPEATRTFFEQAVNARERLGALTSARERAKKIQLDIDSYRTRVVAMAHRHFLTVHDPSAAADALWRGLEQARVAATRFEAASERYESAKAEHERKTAAHARCEADLLGLLAIAGVAGTEAFRNLAKHAARRFELERSCREHDIHLRQLGGPGERFDAFTDRLANADLFAVEHELALVSEEITVSTAMRDALQNEKGSINTELSQLTSDDRASQLRTERADMIEQLRDKAREWATLKTAVVLLDQARKKYEAERQPGVIRQATGFFETVTGGRYRQLVVPLGEQNIFVSAPGGTQLKPDQLSRGTQEQLYLALRFGLIRQFAETATRLPVVVDDILVNFDPERARRAADGFAQLAADHQVIVFTCHPATRDVFRKAQPGACVIELEDSAPEPGL